MFLPKTIELILMLLLVAVLLLVSSEVATALLDNAAYQLKLGRRALLSTYNTTGRGGYN
ncbi:Uncharacterized protein TCM_035479 [Theobroma cacao]|uniref:Uncharacterized protein n=1 Tax=Theobroma cacao TaxID=3641 RepID=A0A061FJ51_THECC|nr:Uncharacterized protein TCM_035479 [Theobroma cacao]